MQTETPLCKLSVVVPLYNEDGSIRPLLDALLPVLDGLSTTYEIILINDGSTDSTGTIINELAKTYSGMVKALHLRINKGKSVALQYGFNHAEGELVVMMDGDLQDNPEEIPRMIRYMEEKGLDVVNGWKFVRHDPISKTLPSRLFNKVLCRFTGLNIHDFNCGLKLIKSECLQNITLYGQLHRFLLVLIANQGYKIGEMPVEHFPRRFGQSKFGSKRLYQGLFDFLTVVFLTRYLRSPLYMFGYYGMACFLVSLCTGLYFFTVYVGGSMLGFHSSTLSDHPLWLLCPFMLIAGLIFICFGLLGELIFYLHAKLHIDRDLVACIGFPSNPSNKSKQPRSFDG